MHGAPHEIHAAAALIFKRKGIQTENSPAASLSTLGRSSCCCCRWLTKDAQPLVLSGVNGLGGGREALGVGVGVAHKVCRVQFGVCARHVPRDDLFLLAVSPLSGLFGPFKG